MMRTGVVACAVAAIVVSMLMSGGALADTVQTFDTAGSITLASSETPGAWYVDRYPPSVFAAGQTAPGDPTGVLEEGVAGTDYQSDSFYNYQGRKYDVNLLGPTQSISIDLYVSNYMLTNWTDVGIWATGVNSTLPATDPNYISAYPIIEFQTPPPFDPDSAFYTFDYNGYSNPNGAWIDGTSVSNAGWYNLEMVLTVGTGMQYYLNGSLFATYGDPYTTNLSNVMLEVGNFGFDYDVSWDNLAALSTPEPISMIFFGTGLVAVSGYVARKKMQRKTAAG
jgi:hypothetical protein